VSARSIRFVGGPVLALAVAGLGSAAVNLNLSKSNVNRLIWQAGLLTEAQAKAMLAELDTLGPVTEAKAKKWLPANFRRFGVDPGRVKKIVVLPPGKAGPQRTIILLADPAAEAEAVAVAVKGSKSNTSE